MKKLIGPLWAQWGILMLLLLSGMAPLHLAQEIHVLLPASAQHHADIHCEQEQDLFCEKPADDVSKPLDGKQHQRHHETQCAGDTPFFFPNAESVSGAPQNWHSVELAYGPTPLAASLEPSDDLQKGRAPPPDESPPPCPDFCSALGRAPPEI